MTRGMGNVRARLEGLKKEIRLEAQERVVLAAERARDQARARAPVDSGALRESIGVQVGELQARVATDCPYAAAVEFGTSRRAPNPFMRG